MEISLKLLDSNCMLGRWKKDKGTCFYTAKDLLKVMDEAGIDKCIAFGSMAKYSHINEGNDELLSNASGNPRIITAAAVIPHHTGEFPEPGEYIKYLEKNDIRAVRIFPAFHGIDLYDWVWEDTFSMLNEHRIPLFIDFTTRHWSENIPWNDIKTICEKYKRMPVILIRMGLKADRYFYPLVRKSPNVFIEISNYITNNGIENLRNHTGAEKIIFGTGMPLYNPVPSIALLKLSDISQTEKQLIGSGNMERLLSEVEF